MQRILELLVASFDYVVIDTASDSTRPALAALELSTDLVLLSAPDVPCVRGTRKEVEALQVLGTHTQSWHFVLNRADARDRAQRRDIESTVGLRVDVAVPESRAVPLSLNQGTPMLESDPRSAVVPGVAASSSTGSRRDRSRRRQRQRNVGWRPLPKEQVT